MVAVVSSSLAQNPVAKPERGLTQEEFLKQIEALSPAGELPKRSAPNPSPAAPAAPMAKVQTAARPPSAPPPVPDMPEERKEKKAKGATEITALETTFDQKTHQAVFIGDVVVKDPEFNVSCDRMTAFLRHDEGPKPEDAGKLKPVPQKKQQGGLDRAIAQGNVIITQDKADSDGSTKRSVGKAARADYSAVTGEVTLTGSPQVQQGINTCVATSPETVMVMTRDGKMRVNGPHRMTIQDKVDSK
jgi:lipopolysaccharide export system protein LptA